jgi:preprotein translocase subunit SecA
VLVGTASVESSETLSRMLKRAKIPHSVLNAKFHAQEAEIVALAGQRGAVTVSTNMAGRGTDIKLGEGVAALGGLFVIGTERHSSRRVDRQLRGRCSRQGDPGRSQFFISLEDDLMRNHAAPDRMAAMIEQSGKSRKPSSLGTLVETAQRQVEQRDYKARKRVLDFDDVMNMQREIVYGYRNEVLVTEKTPAGWFMTSSGKPSLHRSIIIYQNAIRIIPTSASCCIGFTPLFRSASLGRLSNQSGETSPRCLWTRRAMLMTPASAACRRNLLDQEERRMVLIAIDRQWQQHLDDMDELREGVYLRAQGQKDPLVEYKNEAYELFVSLMDEIRQEALQNLFRAAAGLGAFLAQLHKQTPPQGTLKLNLPASTPQQTPKHPAGTPPAPAVPAGNTNNAAAASPPPSASRSSPAANAPPFSPPRSSYSMARSPQTKSPQSKTTSSTPWIPTRSL